MKSLVHTSPFVPAEWVAAHGLRPVRGPMGHAAGLPEGMCAFAGGRMWADPKTRPAGWVWTTTCDQMRRAAEVALTAGDLPVMVMNVPATWQSPASYRYYRAELERLGMFMVRKLGATSPTPERLLEEMQRWEAARQTLRDRRARMSARAHAEAVFALQTQGPAALEDLPPPGAVRTRGLPVILAGAPLLPEEFGLFDLIERAGGRVVLDGTESGEMGWPAPFDRRRLQQEAPFEVLAETYFGTLPGVFRRPNTLLEEWLALRIGEHAPRGLMVVRRPWCDLWQAESAHLREWAPVPVLALDIEPDAGADATVAVRIQAFLETLR